MSILNRPSDGLFNVVIAFIRCLSQNGRMPRDKLLALCAPPSVVTGQNLAKPTLNRWIELGLFEEVDGTIRVARQFSGRLKKKSLTNAAIASVLRDIVWEQRNNESFWDAKKSRAADFTRAASWMLAQDVFAIQLLGYVDAERLEGSQLPKHRVAFTNDTRWAGFKAWGAFLGIGYTGRFPGSGAFIIDPTPIIREPIGAIMRGKKRVPILSFMRQLAVLVPVIDGGVYRVEVESKIKPTAWQKPQETTLSTSLSRALLRLHESAAIRLEDKSDAENLGLLGRDKKVIRRVSHVTRKDGGK